MGSSKQFRMNVLNLVHSIQKGNIICIVCRLNMSKRVQDSWSRIAWLCYIWTWVDCWGKIICSCELNYRYNKVKDNPVHMICQSYIWNIKAQECNQSYIFCQLDLRILRFHITKHICVKNLERSKEKDIMLCTCCLGD